MSIAIVIATAISFVVQVLLIRHKWRKRRLYDLMWDLPALLVSLWLGMVGGATVMAAMLIASTLLSVTLLFGEDRTPELPNIKQQLKKSIDSIVKEIKP